MTQYWMYVRFKNGRHCTVEHMEAEDIHAASAGVNRIIDLAKTEGSLAVIGGVGINFDEVLYLNIRPYPSTETWLDILHSVGLWWKKR